MIGQAQPDVRRRSLFTALRHHDRQRRAASPGVPFETGEQVSF
jgi:hypothetical protein